MTVSFVGAASAEATSLSLPAHQAGDLIVILAGRTGSTTLPTVPSGWFYLFGLTRSGTPAVCQFVAWKIAASSAETSGTWTDATMLSAVVVRDSVNYLVAGGHGFGTRLNTTSVIYSISANPGTSATSMRSQAAAYVLGLVTASTNSSDIETPPTGMTNIIATAGTAAIECVIHRTTSTVTSFSATATVSSSLNYVMHMFEILDTGIAKSAGGGMLIHPGMSGGMRG